MDASNVIIAPASNNLAEYHNHKYVVYLKMHEGFLSYRTTMSSTQ